MFKKYSSLENHTNSKFLEKVLHQVNTQSKRPVFTAREKIHGCNFSFIITKDDIKPAKRTSIIDETEEFYNHLDLLKELMPSLLEVQKNLACEYIQIYGEYAGRSIQKEVDYGDKSFYVFDVLSDDYWSDDQVVEFCKEYNFKIAPLIGRDYIEELLKLPVEFNSIVPSLTKDNMFDLHKQPHPTNNVAEGLVIKPVDNMYLSSGARIAIKYKTDKFKEKGKAKPPKVVVPLCDDDLKLLSQLTEYITEARFSNVISHIGEITAKDFGKVYGLTMRDILKEAEREDVVLTNANAPSKLQKEFSNIIQNELRKIWIDLINY